MSKKTSLEILQTFVLLTQLLPFLLSNLKKEGILSAYRASHNYTHGSDFQTNFTYTV